MNKLSQLIFLSLLVLMLACDEENLPLECQTDLICTEQLVFFSYSPLDDANEPIILDSYYSQNLDNGNTYSFTEEGLVSESGTYVVITDLELDEINSAGTTIRFVGVKDGGVVLEQDFVVGHDCCHIVLLEGPGTE